MTSNPHVVPKTAVENAARSWLAREILATATRKHAGYVDETETYFLQHGVNFMNQPVTVVIIGGTVYHKCQEKAEGYLDDLALIAQGVLYDPNEPHVLRPNGPVLLDAQYLVSILGGLYGRVDPEQALRVMKRELVQLEIKRHVQASADDARYRERLAWKIGSRFSPVVRFAPHQRGLRWASTCGDANLPMGEGGSQCNR
jgi:hypothetical protein